MAAVPEGKQRTTRPLAIWEQGTSCKHYRVSWGILPYDFNSLPCAPDVASAGSNMPPACDTRVCPQRRLTSLFCPSGFDKVNAINEFPWRTAEGQEHSWSVLTGFPRSDSSSITNLSRAKFRYRPLTSVFCIEGQLSCLDQLHGVEKEAVSCSGVPDHVVSEEVRSAVASMFSIVAPRQRFAERRTRCSTAVATCFDQPTSPCGFLDPSRCDAYHRASMGHKLTAA